MATMQLTSAAASISAKGFTSFEGLRASNTVRMTSFSPLKHDALFVRSFRGLVVKAATTVAPEYTSLMPLGDRVLVKIKSAEEKTSGGILLPAAAQSKPEAGEVVAVGEGRAFGKNKVDISVKSGAQVVYSKYGGTEVVFDGSNHLILKEDDIVGILETDDVKDMKPLNDRVLIKVAVAEEKTASGLYLTESSKEKPSIGTPSSGLKIENSEAGRMDNREWLVQVIAVGPGSLDKEGKRKPLSVAPGDTVLYSKYAGNDFNGPDGSEYIALRVSDVLAILS
ncbi:20 kDa chaperonin, chloroplastic [Orobanche gracilis]